MKKIKSENSYPALIVSSVVCILVLVLLELTFFYKILIFILFLLYLFSFHEEIEICETYLSKNNKFNPFSNKIKIDWNELTKVKIMYKGYGIMQNDCFFIYLKNGKRIRFYYSFSKSELNELKLFVKPKKIKLEIINNPFEKNKKIRKLPDYDKAVEEYKNGNGSD